MSADTELCSSLRAVTRLYWFILPNRARNRENDFIFGRARPGRNALLGFSNGEPHEPQHSGADLRPSTARVLSIAPACKQQHKGLFQVEEREKKLEGEGGGGIGW
jgi:hypothetical protein